MKQFVKRAWAYAMWRERKRNTCEIQWNDISCDRDSTTLEQYVHFILGENILQTVCTATNSQNRRQIRASKLWARWRLAVAAVAGGQKWCRPSYLPCLPTQSLLNLRCPPPLASTLSRGVLCDWNRHGELRLHYRCANRLEKAVPGDAPPLRIAHSKKPTLTFLFWAPLHRHSLPDWRRRPDPILNSPRLEAAARRRCGPRCALRPS